MRTNLDKIESKNWFVNPRPNREAKTRLFCFPYAGGGPSAFGPWFAQFPYSIEGWVAHFPGRGSRHLEPAYKKITILVEELAIAIQPLLDRPYAFFGHSFGAVVAFEVTRHFRRCGLPQPVMLFVSACRAPQIPDPHPSIYNLPGVEFIKALKGFNGISPELLQQPEVMDLLLPVLRADFEAFQTYIYASEPPLNYRIVALGGLNDPRISREHLEGWASQTNSIFRSEYFPGDHFFINTARESVIASIAAEMKAFSSL